jgi:beta-glucosidase
MHVMRFVVITAWAWSLHFLSPHAQDFTWYVSSVDGERKLDEATGVFETRHPRGVPVIELDPTTRHQTVFGMGSSFEPTTAYNLAQLDAAERERVLRLLVHPEGANMNLMRICMGTPDFTGDPWYSYNDLPPGETDIDLSQFSVEKDRDYIVPVLKEALAINPNLNFFASPWSPPGWMTSTGDMIGGHLLPEFYNAYAEYFVRFIKAYEAEGSPYTP